MCEGMVPGTRAPMRLQNNTNKCSILCYTLYKRYGEQQERQGGF